MARSSPIGSAKRRDCGELAASHHARATAPIPNRTFPRRCRNSLLTAKAYLYVGHLSKRWYRKRHWPPRSWSRTVVSEVHRVQHSPGSSVEIVLDGNAVVLSVDST